MFSLSFIICLSLGREFEAKYEDTQRTISVLGSTGSIGRQSLEVIAALGLSVGALTAHSSVGLLEEQARRFRPRLVAATDPAAAADLKTRLADTPIRVVSGCGGAAEAATLSGG